MNNEEEELYLTPITGKHVLKIALRVKKLIDTVVPVAFDEETVTKPDSPVLTERIFQLLLEAAGGKGDGAVNTSSRKYRATLVFVLLTCKRWYMTSANRVLYDSTLFELRALAAEHLAKRVIEREEDEYYLFKHVLCQRYTITLHGRDARPANALELAVDQHATIAIGSSGFQRCMQWLWRGWIVQSDTDASEYVFYNKVADSRVMAHFDPDRLKTPKYQNYIQLLFSFLYLGIYTMAINEIEPTESTAIRTFEWLLYIFTFGYVLDEIVKLYDVGTAYIGFWNVFNDTLYAMVVMSMGLRFWKNHEATSYYLLACCAPLIWARLLLYLDSVRFFGAMLVVLEELMKESIIFFVLIFILFGGFLQAFMGLDNTDGILDTWNMVVHSMTRTVLDSPEFDLYEQFGPPFGMILYYVFTFVISTLLLNILIALFNSAYERIYDNANDEFMALAAQKTLRFVRAPDVHVFVPPLNLFEHISLIIPFKWWMPQRQYNRLNDYLMMVLYSPFLLVVAIDEAKCARRVLYNRSKGVRDDSNETDEEWDLFDGYYTAEEILADPAERYGAQNEQMERVIAQGDPEFPIDEARWSDRVNAAAPQVQESEKSGISWENYQLAKRVEELTALVEKLVQESSTPLP
ncbi:calcium channel Yvc1p [Trichomonascus vanleenenianus]|uniref:ion transporter n=1 Tax=Trichomonascus vanleenenianus TaxID=2268995 RepID=UPI003EC9973B